MTKIGASDEWNTPARAWQLARMRLVERFEPVCLALFLTLACGNGKGKGPSSPGESTSGSGGAGTGGGAGAAAEECGSRDVEEGFVEVPATDPGIRYVGRFKYDDPEAPWLRFPATMVETSFEGGAIDLVMNEAAAANSATNAQFYDVQIDDQEPLKLATCPQQSVYPLARGLSDGTHRVRVAKRTEASVGTSAFMGFRVREGTELTLPEAPERRMEFVGDSITCGYGNEISVQSPDNYHFSSTNENAMLAYGAVTAAQLDAEYVAVAASGRGMVRNYGGGGGLLAPEFYELTGPDSSGETWDHERYSPEVIVVNLGTNDFSVGLEGDEVLTMRADYRAAYTEFFAHLRELHPDAALIGAVGPMISDSYPAGYEAWTSIRSDVRGVVDAFVADGDDKVFYFEFATQTAPYGEDWHPTIATHQSMADALTEFIEEELGW